MEYYLVAKTDKVWKWKPARFSNGFTFDNKMSITLYNLDMIRYILMKKINNSLKGIINLYLLYDEEDDSSEDMATLVPRVELLRSIFIEKYALYMTEVEIEAYLMKMDRLLEKIDSKAYGKSRRR